MGSVRRSKNDRVENVERDRHLTVDSNVIELVKADRHLVVNGNFKQEIKADTSTAIKRKESKQVDGTMSITCLSDVVESFRSNHRHTVAATHATQADNIKLDATTAIEFRCGGSSIVLTPAAIFIKGGPLVNINCAEGPPVAPITAQATSPEIPAKPIDADDVTYGTDTRYGGGEKAARADEDEEKESWIEIELVDEAGMPVAGETYDLRLPDGEIQRGTLDANGFVRIDGIEPGTCQVCFPNLDTAAWERI